MFDHRLALFLCLLVATGLAAPLHAQPYERTVRDTVTFSPESVSVENHGGSIRVTTWERDAVAYEARIVSGQSKQFVADTRIEADRFNDRFSLTSDFENLEAQWSLGPKIYGYGKSRPDVHYTLTVPGTSRLSVEDEESEIKVAGLRAALQIDTDEGDVQVSENRGAVQVDTHEGSVSMRDVRGDLKLDTHEGEATVEGLRGRLLLDTHEGQAEVDIDSLGGVDATTHEGRVTLTLPGDAGFDLSTDFDEEADFQSDFALDSLRDEEGNYQGAVQGGGPLVRIGTHEGTMTLRRR
jgi:DUF4097 and DUF4098 domain-containing protein YvlB